MHRQKKSSVAPISWLSRNNRKIYCNAFAASAVLAYGQPWQGAPKNTRDQPTDEFWKIYWKMFFLGILSIQCKIKRDRPSNTRRSTGGCAQPVDQPWPQTGKRGNCRRDIVREIEIFKRDTREKTSGREVHAWLLSTENILAREICFAKSFYD